MHHDSTDTSPTFLCSEGPGSIVTEGTVWGRAAAVVNIGGPLEAASDGKAGPPYELELLDLSVEKVTWSANDREPSTITK